MIKDVLFNILKDNELRQPIYLRKILLLNKQSYNWLRKSKIWCGKQDAKLSSFLKENFANYFYHNSLISKIVYDNSYSVEFHIARLTRMRPLIKLTQFISASEIEIKGLYYYQNYLQHIGYKKLNWQDSYLLRDEILSLLAAAPLHLLNLCYIRNFDFSLIYFILEGQEIGKGCVFAWLEKDKNKKVIFGQRRDISESQSMQINKLINDTSFINLKKIFNKINKILINTH